MTLHLVSGTLAPTAPFDFDKSLHFINGFGPMAGEQAVGGRVLTKAVFAGGQAIVFQVESTGNVEQPRLAYTLHAEHAIDATTQRAAEDRIGFFLSLRDDLAPFYALAEDDLLFAPIARRFYGYHQIKFLTPFECAAWAVLTQRNAMPIARNLKRALAERYGASLEVAGQAYWAFPVAPMLAQADPGVLYDLMPNLRRAEYLQAVAIAFSGADEQWLRSAPYAEVIGWLRGINGIGAWSAGFILLRGLGRTEQLPSGEAKLSTAASKLYGRGRTLSDQSIHDIAGRYGAWQGYWAHYLRAAS
jgi:DNA-3-methyladenine glycosylase II